MHGRMSLTLNPITMKEAMELFLKKEFNINARVDGVTQQELGGVAHQFKIEFIISEKEAE